MDYLSVVCRISVASGTVQTVTGWSHEGVPRTWKAQWSRQGCFEGPVAFSPGARAASSNPAGSLEEEVLPVTFLFPPSDLPLVSSIGPISQEDTGQWAVHVVHSGQPPGHRAG